VPHPASSRLALPLLLAGAVLLPLAACSSDEGSEAATTTATTADPALAALEGRYAHMDAVAYESTSMKTLIISFGLTDFWVEDGELMTKQTFCSSEHRSDQPITVEMSDAATSAIKPIPTAVTVSTVDGRTHLFRPPTPTGIGIRLDDPANESLPTDPNDPRIADDDDDGKPGITVRITVTPELTGELFLARREIFAYQLDVQDDGTLTGNVEDSSEQLVVGASDPIFITADANEWEQVPDPTKSPILLVPIDGSTDCQGLMAQRDALLPPTPEVDW